MKSSFFLFSLFACLFFGACSDEKESDPSQMENSIEKTKLIVNIERLRLRDQAGEEGNVIEELKKGAVLYDLGKVSDFTTRIKLRGVQFDEPWLWVETQTGTQGWVYGGALNFEMKNPTALADFLMEKRLLTLFGESLHQQLKDYREAYYSIQTAAEMAAVYREGISIRDDLVYNIDERIEIGSTEQLPDLFWLKEAFPGFLPQLVAEGTAYYLFADFGTWLKLAQKTMEETDNDFFEFKTHVFPEDSIEYFFPAWTIQTWDYGGHSLLGRGEHKKLLFEIQEKINKDSLFQLEMLEVKDQLVENITNASVTYWETKEKIIQELDSILSADLTIFTTNDKIELQTRRKHFEQAEQFQIETNHKAGIYSNGN